MHKSRLDGLQPYVRDEFAADEAPARPAVAHEYELLLGLLHGLRPLQIRLWLPAPPTVAVVTFKPFS